MDPSLLRERDAFKKRALAQPVVEKRKTQRSVSDVEFTLDSSSSKKQKASALSKPRTDFDYKTAGSASKVGFAVLAKIVKYMNTRYLQGEDYGLTVDEILDETKQYDVSPTTRRWLANEALPKNVKISVDHEGKFKYKPNFNIRNKADLLRLLQEHSAAGNGAITVEEIEESLVNAQTVLEEIKESVIRLKGVNKKDVVFYKDPQVATAVPEELVQLWRNINVEGMDERKIADYLDKHGFSFIKNDEKIPMVKRKKGRQAGKTGPFIPKHNEHVKDLLQDYSAKLNK